MFSTLLIMRTPSSSSITAQTSGTFLANQRARGRWTMVKVYTVPWPLTSVQVASADKHSGQRGRG